MISAVAVLAGGCCKDNGQDIPVTGQAISFTASVPANAQSGVPTRAVATTGTLTDFTVYSFIQGTGQEYMSDVKVRRDGDGVWKYSPMHYWPVGNKLNFYSFAPSREHFQSGDVVAGGNSPDLPDYMNDGTVDLLYGVNMGLDSSTPQVKINFRHALSMVRFNVVPRAGTGASLEIGAVTLENVRQQGSFMFPRQTTSPGDITIGQGRWSDLKNSIDIEVGQECRFMIPQRIAGTAPATLRVKCRILENGRKVWPVGTTATYPDGMADIRIPLSDGAVKEWLQGHAYNYTVSIDNPMSEYIDFDITVNEYEDFMDSPPDNPDVAIDYDATVPEGTNVARFNDFAVWAFADNEILMQGMMVHRDGGSWSYSPQVMWPRTNVLANAIGETGWIDDELRFKNFNVQFSAVTNEPIRIVDFNVGEKAAAGLPPGANGGADMLYACAPGQYYDEKPINLYFRHALAKVVINYRTQEHNLKMRVRGTYFRTNNTVGAFDLPVISTENGNPVTTRSWTSSHPGVIQISKAKPLKWYDNTLSPGCILGPEVYVIPQKVTPWDRHPNTPDNTPTGQYLFLRAMMTQTDADGSETQVWPVHGDAGYVATQGDAYLYVPLSDREMEWKPGYAYVYDIGFGRPNGTFTADDYKNGATYPNTNMSVHVRVFSDFDMQHGVSDYWIYF